MTKEQNKAKSWRKHQKYAHRTSCSQKAKLEQKTGFAFLREIAMDFSVLSTCVKFKKDYSTLANIILEIM